MLGISFTNSTLLKDFSDKGTSEVESTSEKLDKRAAYLLDENDVRSTSPWLHQPIVHDSHFADRVYYPAFSFRFSFVVLTKVRSGSLQKHDGNGNCNAMLLLFQDFRFKRFLVFRSNFPPLRDFEIALFNFTTRKAHFWHSVQQIRPPK